MPGVLIEDMPFALDHAASGVSSSPYLETLASAAPPCIHHIQHRPPSSLLESIMATVSLPDSPRSLSDSPRGMPDSPRGITPDTALSSALHRYLPSNSSDEASWSAEDVYSCDEFRMFEFKVRRCMRGRSHDWTECPFAHPGEKARRRDPRRFHYSGTACPDFRKGSCKNGDACELAHGVFECWLHPARYRTQPCKDGRSCKRRVCFFAHTSEQLRLLPQVSQAMASTLSSSPSSCSSSSASFVPPAASSTSPPAASCCASSPSPLGSDSCASPRRSSMLRSFSDNTKLSVGGGQACAEMIDPVLASGYCCCQHNPRTAAACSATRLISSPTSTLVGLAQSPPPLSPPLSPSHSPPMSPSSSGMPSAVPRRHMDSRRMGFASAPSSPASHHPLHAKAMCDLFTALQQLELQKSVAMSAAAPHGTAGMPLGTSGGAAGWAQYSSGPSPLRPVGNWATCGVPRGTSVSLPCTPTKPRWETMWEMEMGEEDLEEQEMMSMAVPRVESGRDLRAKIYGRLASKAGGSGDGGSGLMGAGSSSGFGDPGFGIGSGEGSPDLNWVNDLVTE